MSKWIRLKGLFYLFKKTGLFNCVGGEMHLQLFPGKIYIAFYMPNIFESLHGGNYQLSSV